MNISVSVCFVVYLCLWNHWCSRCWWKRGCWNIVLLVLIICSCILWGWAGIGTKWKFCFIIGGWQGWLWNEWQGIRSSGWWGDNGNVCVPSGEMCWALVDIATMDMILVIAQVEFSWMMSIWILCGVVVMITPETKVQMSIVEIKQILSWPKMILHHTFNILLYRNEVKHFYSIIIAAPVFFASFKYLHDHEVWPTSACKGHERIHTEWNGPAFIGFWSNGP